MIPENDRHDAALALAVAERDRSPVAPLTETYPKLDIDDAYAVQQLQIEAKLATGATLRGHKVGLTSEAMQQQLGVDEPDYGHLLDSMLLGDGDTVVLDDLCSARVEPEVAFMLRDSLRGPSVTVADVLAATERLVPAIEIIDSRILDWRLTLVDTIADNASSGRVVLGATSEAPTAVARAELPVVLRRNEEAVAEGSTAAVLGDPALAVAWLANTLARHGMQLEAGQIVMPGSCTAAIPAVADDVVTASFGGLGSVTVRFA